jgi:hypothetical protein
MSGRGGCCWGLVRAGWDAVGSRRPQPPALTPAATGQQTAKLKITDKAMKAFEAAHLQRHEFHGDWNYTVTAAPG